jgi:CheY-like chemotaxis protein
MKTLQKMKFSVKAVEDGNAAVRAIEETDYDLMYAPSLLSSLIPTDSVDQTHGWPDARSGWI